MTFQFTKEKMLLRKSFVIHFQLLSKHPPTHNSNEFAEWLILHPYNNISQITQHHWSLFPIFSQEFSEDNFDEIVQDTSNTYDKWPKPYFK